MPVRIEEIIERIRREIADEANAAPTDRSAPSDVDRLPAIATRPELDYLNRNWHLFDPLSEMRSHRRWFGPLVVSLRWKLRRVVLGVLDRYFEKERLFLIELVRFNNALAERSDRLLREVTERTKAVAERNDLFLGALDVRLEALEAREQLRRVLVDSPRGLAPQAGDAEESVLAEMAIAVGAGLGERVRPFGDYLRSPGPFSCSVAATARSSRRSTESPRRAWRRVRRWSTSVARGDSRPRSRRCAPTWRRCRRARSGVW